MGRLSLSIRAYAQGGFFAEWHLSPTTLAYQDFIAGILAVLMGFILLVSDRITGAKQPAQ